MKKINKIICILSLSISILGCNAGGTYSPVKLQNADSGDSYMEMKYKSFDGYRYKKIQASKGEKLNLNIDVNTQKGKLKVLVLNKNNKKIYSITNPEEEVNKDIEIDKDGKYTIKIEGKKHDGSFCVKWTVE